jgi:hypothetical protein
MLLLAILFGSSLRKVTCCNVDACGRVNFFVAAACKLFAILFCCCLWKVTFVMLLLLLGNHFVAACGILFIVTCTKVILFFIAACERNVYVLLLVHGNFFLFIFIYNW